MTNDPDYPKFACAPCGRMFYTPAELSMHRANHHSITKPLNPEVVGVINDLQVEKAVISLLLAIGEKPEREGLQETPKRVAKAFKEWFGGYTQNVDYTSFADGGEGYDEMVVIRDIPFYTHCEHHMAPFFGKATIGYIPNGKIIGLSKASRLLDVYAKRLQVQERLTTQVVEGLEKVLNPLGCGIIIKARHLCMESRGICKQGHETVTSALRGKFKTDASVRAEFMALK